MSACVPLLDEVLKQAAVGQPYFDGAESAWLAQLRQGERAVLAREGLPDRHNEAWKYTSLRALAQQRFIIGDSEAGQRPVPETELHLPGVDGPRIVFVHGVFRADLSSLQEMPAGLEVTTLGQVLSTGAASLRSWMERPIADGAAAFERMNLVMATDGVSLRVKAGFHIEAPVHLLYLGIDTDAKLAWHTRAHIELQAGAELSLVEHYAGSSQSEQFATVVSEIRMHEDARLQLTQIQHATEAVTLVRHEHFHLAPRAHVGMHTIELGGALVRHEIETLLEGEGAIFDTCGLFAPQARQHVDIRLDIRHQARDTRSSATWRGIADQRGHGVFHGGIVIERGADGADARLHNKNLLLSDRAEIDTQPVLEIYADEVQAAHGATVGQINEQALFYLRSRGLPLAEARRLLMVAFCREILDGIFPQSLQEYLAERLIKHLPLSMQG